MKIAVDLDATITARPKLFNELMKGWVSLGHEVIILTGTITSAQVGVEEKELQLGRIQPTFLRGEHFTDIVVVLGYGETVEKQVDGCRRLKGEWCYANKVDMFIDNDPKAQWEAHRRSPQCSIFGMVSV